MILMFWCNIYFLCHNIWYKRNELANGIPFNKTGLRSWKQRSKIPKQSDTLIKASKILVLSRSWGLHFTRGTTVLKAWLFAEQCFITGQRWGKMPCQQRAVARGQRTIALPNGCQKGVGSGWRVAEKHITNQIHLPSSSPKSEKREKILVAAHCVQILPILGLSRNRDTLIWCMLCSYYVMLHCNLKKKNS